MRTGLSLLVLACCTALVGCDSNGPDSTRLDDPRPGMFALVVETEGNGTARASGEASYRTTDLARRSGGRAGTVRLQPDSDVARLSVDVSLYWSQDEAAGYPSPGLYDVTSAFPFVVRVEQGGRTYSAYQGTLTIESASEDGVVGTLDLKIKTGSTLFPDILGPHGVGTASARFHSVRVEGESDSDDRLPDLVL